MKKNRLIQKKIIELLKNIEKIMVSMIVYPKKKKKKKSITHRDKNKKFL